MADAMGMFMRTKKDWCKNGTLCFCSPYAKSVSFVGLVKCKGTTKPEQRLHSVLTRCFPSTPFYHQSEKKVIGFMLFDKHGISMLDKP